MKKKHIFSVGIVVVLLGAFFLLLNNGSENTSLNNYTFLNLPASPLDATYNIYGNEITLTEGVYESEGEAVSAIKEPMYGELNDDEAEDAAFVLVYSKGGTTTYHVAVALGDNGGFLGLNTFELERSDEPITLSIEDLTVVVSYRPRQPELSHTENEYYTLTNGLVLINKTPEAKDTIYKGNYVYGHESRTFTPCGSENTYWISPKSGSNAALKAIYEEKTRDLEPYTPIYIVLNGTLADGPAEGFGADFEYALEVNTILSVPQSGGCVNSGEEDHISP
jgi:putative lipoprotein